MTDSTAPNGLAREQKGSRPVPDPTTLTTAAVDALQEQTQRELSWLERVILERIKRNDVVNAEKLDSVNEKLSLIERQRVEQKSDTEKAVQAALNAAKEAVKEQTAASETSTNKSETATTKSIDQLAETFNTAIAGLRREIGNNKDKINAIEQRKEGGREARVVAQETRAGLSSVAQVSIAALGLLLLLVSTIGTLVALGSGP